MLPLTVAAEIRDDVSWVAEMLPLYQESCEADPGRRYSPYRLKESCCNLCGMMSWILTRFFPSNALKDRCIVLHCILHKY